MQYFPTDKNCWVPQQTGETTVTEERIERILNEAEKKIIEIWDRKELIVSYRLKNGFTVTGRAACVDPKTYSYETGLKICFNDAKNQLWQVEGYLLQCKLYGDN